MSAGAVSSLTGHLLRWACRLSGLQGPSTLSILIFHRVHAQPDPLFPGEMCAARFDRLLAMLASSHRVVTLGQAAHWLEQGVLPRGCLAISFDDGYADNARIALPLLRRHALPATFFVASGFLDGGRMWNDTIIESVRRSDRDEIDLRHLGLPTMSLRTAGERRAAIEALLPRIKYLSLTEREQALRALHERCGRPTLPDDLMMSGDEVRQLHRAGMEIGGHTVHHPILRVLSDSESEREMRDGRDALQSLINAPVDVFAYPNGRPGEDYERRHVEMARRLGFRAAVSTAQGVTTARSDRFQLPRYTPWEPSPWRWSARLLANTRRRAYAMA